jgi:hypothetical protein
MLLCCKETKSDGFVPDDEIAILVYPDTEKNGQRDAGRLVEVGLLERGADGRVVLHRALDGLRQRELVLGLRREWTHDERKESAEEVAHF